MWVSIHLRNIALNFFRWVDLRFRDIGDLLLNEKQKKPFVSLKDEVTITQSLLTSASLAQVDNATNRADSNLFCHDTRALNSRSVKSVFFCSVFFFFQKPSLCLCN